MNATQVEKLRAKLIQACDDYIVGGGKIITGSFKNTAGQCPLLCLCGYIDSVSMTKEISSMIGGTVSVNELWTIIDSFDHNHSYEYSKPFVAAKLLGKELRARYIKE
jgi:hypothetical protein